MSLIGKHVVYRTNIDNPKYHYGNLNQSSSVVQRVEGVVTDLIGVGETVSAIVKVGEALFTRAVDKMEINKFDCEQIVIEAYVIKDSSHSEPIAYADRPFGSHRYLGNCGHCKARVASDSTECHDCKCVLMGLER